MQPSGKLFHGSRRQLLAALICFAALQGCSMVQAEKTPAEKQAQTEIGSADLKEGIVCTIDGISVGKEEFSYYLRNEKAAAVHDFCQEHELQQAAADESFWTEPVNGQTPLQLAQKRALEALIRDKQILLCASENQLIDGADYESLLSLMDAQNAARAQAKEKGKPVYGNDSFDKDTWIPYLCSGLKNALRKDWITHCSPSDTDLKAIYDENPDLFSTGRTWTLQMIDASGKSETIILEERAVGKENEEAQQIVQLLDQAEPGDLFEQVSWNGAPVSMVVSKAEQGTRAGWKEVRQDLETLYAAQDFSRMLDERCANAQVQLDQQEMDSVRMP